MNNWNQSSGGRCDKRDDLTKSLQTCQNKIEDKKLYWIAVYL